MESQKRAGAGGHLNREKNFLLPKTINGIVRRVEKKKGGKRES